jgi:hypothetical protein
MKLHQICEHGGAGVLGRDDGSAHISGVIGARPGRRFWMSLTTVGLIAAIAWISLLILVVAVCRAAAHADSASDRFHAALH